MRSGIRTIAGADISLSLYSQTVFAGIVVLSFPEMRVLSYSLVQGTARFPYVPGYLAFREVPTIMEAWEQLPEKPDVIMFDGNGILHARRMGIASHFGVLADCITMGCAKKKLAGKFDEPGEGRGQFSEVIDKGDTIGFALRTKERVKPVFISPGHGMSLEDSLNIAMQSVGKYRLPEPTRRAHEHVNLFRTGALPAGYHKVDTLTLF
ncbi:endonuclease V [Dyadobacter sandarakinus]|uniref:Endonuclease V n=2 Tax=Dyadobacter sandarakinus TaxID=2747268 RepID=A0ABX7IDJ9_9BACT|nr:endonuclease V [Dyadobacter sandarakinus]